MVIRRKNVMGFMSGEVRKDELLANAVIIECSEGALLPLLF